MFVEKELASDHLLGPHGHGALWHHLEVFVDEMIPYLLVIITVLLVLENPFWTLYPLDHWEPYVTWFVQGVIVFFLVDLAFKWTHVRNVTKFIKLYWIDILAVMPFYLAFRIYARFTSLASAGEDIAKAQELAHEAVLAREAQLAKEVEALVREERLLKEAQPITRAVRTAERSLRMVSGRQEVTHAAMKDAILKHEDK